MRGVGRDADHAFFAGSRNNFHPFNSDVAAALCDDPHPSAVMELHVEDCNTLRIGNGDPGIEPSGGPEDHRIPDRGLQITAENPNPSVRTPFSRNGMGREPVVIDVESRFASLGIELQQTGIGVDTTFVIEETQASVRQIASVFVRELQIEPSVSGRPYGTFGVERAGKVDRKIADRDVAATFEVER